MTLNVYSDLNGASPGFTLTCISTGGPATTVTWTRDSDTAMGDAVTVFNDVATARYTHTLTVTGRLGGDYQCTVSNVKPSIPSASLRIQGTAYKVLHCMSNSVHAYTLCTCVLKVMSHGIIVLKIVTEVGLYRARNVYMYFVSFFLWTVCYCKST